MNLTYLEAHKIAEIICKELTDRFHIRERISYREYNPKALVTIATEQLLLNQKELIREIKF